MELGRFSGATWSVPTDFEASNLKCNLLSHDDESLFEEPSSLT